MKKSNALSLKEVLPSLEYIIDINVLLSSLNYRLRDTLYSNNRNKKFPRFEVSTLPEGDIIFILAGTSNTFPREDVIIGRLKPDLNTLKYVLDVEKGAESFNFDNLAKIANDHIQLLVDCIVTADKANPIMNIRRIIEHSYQYIMINNLINNVFHKLSNAVYRSNTTFDYFRAFNNTIFKDGKIIINIKNGKMAYSTDNGFTFNETFVCTPVLENPVEYIVEIQPNEVPTIRPTMEEKACTAIAIKNVLTKFVKNIDGCLNSDNPTLILMENNLYEDREDIGYDDEF